MKNNQITKYQPEEILELLKAFYNFQSVFDPEVDKGCELTFDTTIEDWRMICDLLEPKELADYYHEFFSLSTPRIELEEILNNQRFNTLRDFSNYISKNAVKEKVVSIKLLGNDCLEAAIFKTLMSKLNKQGVDTTNIKPSSPFQPFFDNNLEAIMETANKLVPGSISTFEHEENETTIWGWRITILGILAVIIISIFWSFNWLLLIPVITGIVFISIGLKKEPKKYVIGGYETIGELIKGMKEKMNVAT